MFHGRRCLATALVLVVVFSGSAGAQPRPLSLVGLIEVPRLSDPQVSPRGDQLLYVRSDADWKANKRITQVWRVRLDGEGAVPMTAGAEGSTSPRWSPDGRTIAFLAKRGDAEGAQVQLMSNEGGEARALSRHPSAVSDIQWAPDGSALYFIAPEPKTPEEKAKEKAKDDIVAYDEDFKQRHLWRVSVPGGATRRITEGDFSVTDYEVSRDGRRIAHHRAPTPLFGDGDKGEVWVMDAAGGGALQLTRNAVGESGASVSPDGTLVMFLAGADERFDGYHNRRVFVAPVSGGEPRSVAPSFRYEVENASWSKDGRSVFVVANMGVHSEVFRLELATGRAHQLSEGSHALGSWSYSPATDRQVFIVDEPSSPGEVWTIPAGGATPVRVTRVFDAVRRDYRLARQERIEWKGADGVRVEGLLSYPLDYRAGERYPLVVQTHGGPQSSDKFGFGSTGSYAQVLAARGYAVLRPNYRGSTGYGDDFLRDMVGSYFKNSHLDVMAGVDEVIRMGVADPDRLVKMGWSAGGHMTNKIITFTGRFKAASSGAGAANWVSMYGQSDVRTYRTPWFGGTPWQKDAPIDVYWEHSPLKYVANVTTPTLFLVGEKDVRVPMSQSVEMHRALKANGVPTRLYIAAREPHGWQELRHQLFKANVELEWFEKYVLGRTYGWEKAPVEAPPEKDKDKEHEKEATAAGGPP